MIINDDDDDNNNNNGPKNYRQVKRAMFLGAQPVSTAHCSQVYVSDSPGGKKGNGAEIVGSLRWSPLGTWCSIVLSLRSNPLKGG